MAMFLFMAMFLSTKCFLLFTEVTSWYRLDVSVALALCELLIRCSIINCARVGRFHDLSVGTEKPLPST